MKIRQYDTILQALMAAPVARPFATMYRSDDDVETVTFGEFIRQAQQQAASFVAHGLQDGDTVILIMPQGIPLMASFVAAMLVGAIPSIIAYPNFKIEPAKYRFGLAGLSKNLGARLVVLDQDFPDDLLSHVTIGEGAKVIRVSAEQNIARDRNPAGMASISGDRIAFIQHSAGTTGLQKGVALTHSCVLTQLQHLASAIRLTDDDRIYSWLPLYHDMGLIACFMLPLVTHVPVVMQTPTDWVVQPASMPSLIDKYRCTLAWIPNFAFQFLARRVPLEERATLDLSSLRMLINCSEPVRAQSMDEFCAAYAGCGLRSNVVQTSYAMAENVFAVTQSGGEGPGASRIWVNAKALKEDHVAEVLDAGCNGSLCFVSSGKCLPNNRVRILGATGQDLPSGHVGEIAIQSDSLLSGYYNRPDLTAKALKDGWYWSGDLGFCIDNELYVIGRKNDLIIVAGKNIYPQDIEEIVGSDARIHDGRVVAFGLFNRDLGTEDIVVVAEVQDESEIQNAFSIEQALRNAVVAELGVAVRAVYIKPPRWLVKSTAGKPARSATRDKLIKEQPELRNVETP